KSEALVAYLATPAGRAHPRDTLAALLWGDTPEPQARQSLRQALGSLRRLLGQEVVLTQGDTVALDAAAVEVDVMELEAGLASDSTDGLEHAVTLYTGEFLAGLRVSEEPFEEWLTVQRERVHELVLEALARLLRGQIRQEHIQAAIQTAWRVL